MEDYRKKAACWPSEKVAENCLKVGGSGQETVDQCIVARMWSSKTPLRFLMKNEEEKGVGFQILYSRYQCDDEEATHSVEIGDIYKDCYHA